MVICLSVCLSILISIVITLYTLNLDMLYIKYILKLEEEWIEDFRPRIQEILSTPS